VCTKVAKPGLEMGILVDFDRVFNEVGVGDAVVDADGDISLVGVEGESSSGEEMEMNWAKDNTEDHVLLQIEAILDDEIEVTLGDDGIDISNFDELIEELVGSEETFVSDLSSD
jgi:hypothetical protein